MAHAETDAAFLDRLEELPRYVPAYRTLDSDRLFDLARRGAEAAIALVRDATLEEAATALQNLWRIEDCYGAAAAIRALKDQTTT